jgi:dinuclear metal center YbgI/SA1388 family protein
MKLKDLTHWLETLAPLAYQESYDNAGLICGDSGAELSGALVCLDSTEAVIEEAIARKCNLVIAHHPIVFSGLKKLTGKNYIERTLIKAIKNDIAIYAIHTNLDNVLGGVNTRIAEKLGLIHTRILVPKSQVLRKMVTFVPEQQVEAVRQALFAAGAGNIGAYDCCSFGMSGTGTYRAGEGATPFAGQKGEVHQAAEQRLEVMYPLAVEKALIQALKAAHPYEEVAYDLIALANTHAEVGSGLVGELPKAMEETEFLLFLKKTMKTGSVRHTPLRNKKVQRVAVCGGAGVFLLPDAIASESDVFVTADVKYHQFFDADGRIVIADVGHFESEQFTKDLLFEEIRKKFPTFAVHLSEINTNPVNYL